MKYKQNYNKTEQEDKTQTEEQINETSEFSEMPEISADNQEGDILETSAKEYELQQEIDELKDKNIRLMAEFDNFRKRTIREKDELTKTAGEKIFTDILTLIDDFERAQKSMETSQDINAVKEGINLIYSKFISFLAANGVKEINTENVDFDTDIHEAITTFLVTDESQKGKIIDCATKGYTLNDKVIRFAKVVVGE